MLWLSIVFQINKAIIGIIIPNAADCTISVKVTAFMPPKVE